MYKKILKDIAKSVLLDGIKKKTSEHANVMPSDDPIRIVKEMAFTQPGTFRGFKRYRLTIYEVPGVDEGIEHFRNNNVDIHFEIKKGTPIKLVFKEAPSYKVMEVYADGHKIGVMYESTQRFQDLFSKPFDSICLRIVETVGKGQYFDGIEVFLFAHYIE